MPAGRPTKYKPDYAEIAQRLCFYRGFTLKEVAQALGVDVSTVNRWKDAHQEFKDALRAREDADDKVVKSLHQTALEGNTSAQIFWLKNRDSKRWRDRQEVEHSGSIDLAARMTKAQTRTDES